MYWQKLMRPLLTRILFHIRTSGLAFFLLPYNIQYYKIPGHNIKTFVGQIILLVRGQLKASGSQLGMKAIAFSSCLLTAIEKLCTEAPAMTISLQSHFHTLKDLILFKFPALMQPQFNPKEREQMFPYLEKTSVTNSLVQDSAYSPHGYIGQDWALNKIPPNPQ